MIYAIRMNKVIMCCMRLHNLCVERRLSEFSAQAFHPSDAVTNTREGVVPRPQFDRDGIPVELLTWHGEEGREREGGNSPAGRGLRGRKQSGLPPPTTNKREAMIAKYRNAGVLRPSA